MERQEVLRGRYQESLRAIGAWLDIRGFSEVRIFEEGGEMIVEASGTQVVPASAVERFHLDRDSIERLCRAARDDRDGRISTRSLNSSLQTVGPI
jgi:hypothetical protein